MLMFETIHFPEMMDALVHTPREAMQLLAGYFQKQMEAGQLQQINPSATAQAFISMLFGYAVGLEPVQTLLPAEISFEAMTAEFVRIQLQRLAVLPETDQAIPGSPELQPTLSVLLKQVQRQLEVDAVAVLLYQPELLSLEFTAGQGFHTQSIQSTSVRLGEGPAGRVALEVNLPDGFTVFSFPREHKRRLRTSNYLERLNQEIKRRTRVVRVFPNEQSCLRLISAILMEVSEDWEYGKIYLRMESSLGIIYILKGSVTEFTEKMTHNLSDNFHLLNF